MQATLRCLRTRAGSTRRFNEDEMGGPRRGQIAANCRNGQWQLQLPQWGLLLPCQKCRVTRCNLFLHATTAMLCSLSSVQCAFGHGMARFVLHPGRAGTPRAICSRGPSATSRQLHGSRGNGAAVAAQRRRTRSKVAGSLRGTALTGFSSSPTWLHSCVAGLTLGTGQALVRSFLRYWIIR